MAWRSYSITDAVDELIKNENEAQGLCREIMLLLYEHAKKRALAAALILIRDIFNNKYSVIAEHNANYLRELFRPERELLYNDRDVAVYIKRLNAANWQLREVSCGDYLLLTLWGLPPRPRQEGEERIKAWEELSKAWGDA